MVEYFPFAYTPFGHEGQHFCGVSMSAVYFETFPCVLHIPYMSKSGAKIQRKINMKKKYLSGSECQIWAEKCALVYRDSKISIPNECKRNRGDDGCGSAAGGIVVVRQARRQPNGNTPFRCRRPMAWAMCRVHRPRPQGRLLRPGPLSPARRPIGDKLFFCSAVQTIKTLCRRYKVEKDFLTTWS